MPERLPGHHSASLTRKQDIARAVSDQLSAAVLQVTLQPFQRFFAKRNQALLVALAHDAYQPLAQVHLPESQAHQFRHPQPGGVEHFEHGAVAQTQSRVAIRSVKQCLHIRLAERLRQGTARLGALDQQRRVLSHEALAHGPAEESAQRGKLPGGGPDAEPAGLQVPEVFEQVKSLAALQIQALTAQPDAELTKIAAVISQAVVAEPFLHPAAVQPTLDQYQSATIHLAFYAHFYTR